ncbi:MAG: SHOCT domain-containing protein [Roseburia sp.]|nr:SHOCT domain-containing protein [Roseburia sp.]
MGIFDIHTNSGDLAIAPKANDGKLYKYVQLAAISIFIISAALTVFRAFGLLNFGANGIAAILSVGVVGLGGMVALPWVRVLEAVKGKQFKITAIVFLSLIGVCVILWIVSVWQVVGLVNKSEGESADGLSGSFKVIQATLIVSMQFVICSAVAMNIVKYRKTLLPYQIMAGAAYLYIDFYLSLVFTALTITRGGLEFSKTAILLTNLWLHALLLVFVALAVFPNIVFNRIDKRNILTARAENLKTVLVPDEQAEQQPHAATGDVGAPADSDEPVEEKLRTIKALLDNGLITQAEYDEKRAEIIKNI